MSFYTESSRYYLHTVMSKERFYILILKFFSISKRCVRELDIFNSLNNTATLL